jgi:hypothetical protein
MDSNDIQACVAVGRAPSFNAAGRGGPGADLQSCFPAALCRHEREEFQAFAESKPLRKEFMGAARASRRKR